jgi:hypothetical protein
MAACGAAGRGFESLWARFNIDTSPIPLYIKARNDHIIGFVKNLVLFQDGLLNVEKSDLKPKKAV